MVMKKREIDTAWTSYFFLFLLTSGVIILLLSFFFLQTGSIITGLRQIGSGVLLIGIGEWLNHPLQKSISVKKEEDLHFHRFLHRNRSPRGIGNILEIIGLLLIFIGIGSYI